MMFADFSGNESITLFETQLKIIEEMDLSKPIGILGEIEKEAIVNESESSEEDMLSISYKVNIRVIDIITLQECKDVKVRIKKDKNYGKMESKIEDSTIMEEFVESNAEVLYKGKDSGIIESGGIESGIIESKFIESSFVESSEYDSVNGVVPIDLASEFKDEISCLCIVFESMIESHDIETLASLAKEHKGKNKFAIAFKQNNQAYVMQSNLSVSESLMQKLKATFPKAKVTTEFMI